MEGNRIAPFQSSYNVIPPDNTGRHLQARHVTMYEYPFPKTNISNHNGSGFQNNGSAISQTDDLIRFDYRQQSYRSNNELVFVNMKAKIQSPSGKIQYCKIISSDDHHFNIRFLPTEIGEHIVSVKQNHQHVAGSPFKIYVGSVQTEKSEDISLSGSGLEGGYTNSVNSFYITMKDSKAGELTTSIDGPSEAYINLTENGPGLYQVNYQVPVSGEYLCSIKLNDNHIAGSPLKLIINNKTKEETSNGSMHAKLEEHLTLAAIQNQGVPIGRSTAFTLNQSGINPNSLRAYMITPSNKKEDVKVNSIGNDKFNLRMAPHEKGIHKIYVLMGDLNIPGSPFDVMCGEIVVFGTGLIEAKIYEMNSFKIDTNYADPDSISITIEGPSKIELHCFEFSDGYEMMYCPTVPGDYIISIKYKNTHIHGSPFKVNVWGENSQSRIITQKHNSKLLSTSSPYLKSYPENVRCHGDGILHAFLGRNNRFIADASTAGAGVLYVGISGPSKPCEEINVKHIGEQQFQVNYFVQENGPHTISVRWNETDVPHSPFKIYVQ